MRQNFKPQVMIAAWARCNGRCEKCGPRSAKLVPGNIFYDHIIPDYLGGPPTLKNCQVLCFEHHDRKTREQDRPVIDKSRRIRKREAGVRKTRRTIGGKRFDGTPIPPRWITTDPDRHKDRSE